MAEKAIGEVVRDIRIAKYGPRSLRYFAMQIGKAPVTVSRFERGEISVGAATIMKMARVLGMKEKELLKMARMSVPKIYKGAR